MKLIRFLFSLAFTVALVYAMNKKIGPVPPLGKFLDPVNGFWANAESDISMTEEITLPGIEDKVKILYDDMLVPHVFAENENDLFMAIGYVHAYHRLWQMEFQTHAAAGRLSEIVGELTLDMDRGQRRKGMVYGATSFINNLDQKSKVIMKKYTEGVNAFIAQLSYKTYPFEYKLLDYQPEFWTPIKSGLLYKYMSEMLNSGEKDLENTNFRSIYGKELLDLIYPDVDNYEDPVIENENAWDFNPIVKENTNLDKDELVTINLLEQANPNNGSNNWAVGPSKSATGNPILCNDMHLNLYMPSLWFYNQLNCGEMNVFGHSLPGIPFVITGFTDSIAWGNTNAQRDLVDWYKIEYEDETRNKYLLDGEFIPTIKKVEEIKIRGSETFYDTVVYTLFGPVTYDNSFRTESQKNGYAMRWIDHDPSSGFNMFYQINRAKNFDDYMEALDNYTSPAQNIIFASVQGDIAHRVQGKYPLNNFEEGKFLKDGTVSSNNWTHFIPNEHNPFWKNPERGFVSSANQHPADSMYPYYITARSFEAYRNRRINAVLSADNELTIEELKALQFDNFGMKASESLHFMIENLKGVNLSAIEMDRIEKLKSWDFFYNAESKEAVYYDIWFRKLYVSIWDEIKKSRDKNVMLKYPTNYSTIKLMKKYPDLDFFDNKLTETKESVKDLILYSFREMMREVADLEKNGEISLASFKSTYVGHQLRIKSLGNHNIKAGGSSGDIVNATGVNHGPSQRIIVELDPKGVKAWGHYPGGQSGNPGSKYYDNMVEPWANGDYFELLFLNNPNESNARIIFSQTIIGK